jgi:hypothetical protein
VLSGNEALELATLGGALDLGGVAHAEAVELAEHPQLLADLEDPVARLLAARDHVHDPADLLRLVDDVEPEDARLAGARARARAVELSRPWTSGCSCPSPAGRRTRGCRPVAASVGRLGFLARELPPEVPRVIAEIEEVVAIWRRRRNRLDLAYGLVWLAFAYGRAGRREAARATALEALELFGDAGDATGLALVFRDLAFLLTWEGRHADAIRMAGVSESVTVHSS